MWNSVTMTSKKLVQYKDNGMVGNDHVYEECALQPYPSS